MVFVHSITPLTPSLATMLISATKLRTSLKEDKTTIIYYDRSVRKKYYVTCVYLHLKIYQAVGNWAKGAVRLTEVLNQGA